MVAPPDAEPQAPVRLPFLRLSVQKWRTRGNQTQIRMMLSPRWMLIPLMLALAACGGEGEEPATETAETLPEPAVQAEAASTPAESSLRDPVAVAGEMLPYGESEDALIRGYFAFPETMVEPLPAVIVIHEWWGLNDDIKAAAEQIAAQGFMTLAVDLYDGEVTKSNVRAGELSRDLLESMDAADANITAAIGFLTEVAGAPAVATLGWSQGAQWSVRTAQNNAEAVTAAVSYYGQPDSDPEALATLDTPLLAIFAGRDRSIPITDARTFRDAALNLGKPVEVVVEPDALHGFANPGDARYNEASAARAFARTIAFLREHLGA